jgi:hypothetical protein
MQKLLIVGSTIMAAILLVGGLYFPNEFIMWMASTSLTFAVTRGVIILALLGLLFTHPPRKVWFRMLLAIAAVSQISWALAEINSGSIHILDAMLLLNTGIIFAIAALELQPVNKFIMDYSLSRNQSLQKYATQ